MAAATFVACAAFWIPLGALFRRPLQEARWDWLIRPIQLAAAFAVIVFFATLVGVIDSAYDIYEHPDEDPRRCLYRC